MNRLPALLGLTRSLLIYRAQPWRSRALVRFLGGFVRPGDLVFDIGAHVGNRSLAMARLGARVVAVEPQPLFAGFLERTLAHRLLAVERCALGARAGDATLHVSSCHPTVSTLSAGFMQQAAAADGFSHVRWDSARRVPVRTLDALVETYGRPAFCKIDVEGAEAEILSGLHHPIPIIAFEYVPPMRSVALDALDQVSRLGPYCFNRVAGENGSWAGTGWHSAGAMAREIRALPADAGPGDIYAALPGSPLVSEGPGGTG